MKKLIQTLFVLLIISSTQLSYAAGNKSREKALQTAQQDTGSVHSLFFGVHPNIGGEMILVVTVLDLTSHPIQGATVSAPCTGMGSKLTDVNGVAKFDMGTVCSCNTDPCTVTTPKGCYQQIKVTCDKYNVVCNQ